jgi:hypothetical protein
VRSDISIVEADGPIRVPDARSELQTGALARRRIPAIGLFVLGLEFAMFSPLLRPGTVWLLDSPSYLMGPHPALPQGSWAAAPWRVVRAPFETALSMVYRFLPWGQVRLLPLLLVPVLATFGFRLLFDGDWIATIASSLLFVVNPFVYERMLAGQEYFLLGVAALPLSVALVVRARSAVKSGIAVGSMLAALITISPHLAFIGAVLLAGLIASGLINRTRTLTMTSVVALGVAGAATLAWVIPSGFAGQSATSGLDVQLFQTAADSRLGLLPNVIGMYGFWRAGWPLAKESLSTWPLIFAAIIVVAGSGAVSMRHSRFRAPILGIGLAGLGGLLLALGNRGPTGALYSWLYREAPWFRVMREPQKFLVLLVLAYAVMFGFGVSALVRGTSSRRARLATLALLLSLPCVYSFRSFWGFAGYIHPSPEPTSWVEANAVMGDGPGAVLVLPWHRYVPFPWTQYRVVASPLASAFSRPAILSDDPEFGALEDLAADPRARSIGPLLRSGASRYRFGARVASLGVAYVVLAKIEDWHADDWLYGRSDLELVGDWEDLAVFRVTPRGAPG